MSILLHFNSPSQFYDEQKQLNVDKLGHDWEFASVKPSKSKKVEVDVKMRFVFSNHSSAFNLWQQQQKSLCFSSDLLFPEGSGTARPKARTLKAI